MVKQSKHKPIYEPDESHREKHHGDSPEPKLMEDDDGHPIGKCSRDIDLGLAQELLDSGIEWRPRSDRRSPWPDSIFNVFRGVPYRAHRRGKTRYYHGFPDVKRRIPKAVRDELRERAIAEGTVEAFDAWMRQTQKYS